MAGDGLPTQAEEQVLKIAEIVEEQVDSEIRKLDEIDDDDMMSIRERRRKQLQAMQKQKERWMKKGHGVYQDCGSAEQFFKWAKESERVVCHFARDATERCRIVDRHLTKLAPKYFETLFIRVDAEKIAGLAEKFNVFMLPTIMLIEGGKTHHSIIGFDEFGGKDSFPTSRMEAVLAHQGMINENGMFSSDQAQADGE